MARAQTGSPNISNSIFLWKERTVRPLPKRKGKRDCLFGWNSILNSGPTVWVQKLQCESFSLWMLLTPLEACNSTCFQKELQGTLTTVSKTQSHNTRVETVRVLERPKKTLIIFKETENNLETPKSLRHRLWFWKTSATIKSKRTSTQASIKSECHSQPTLPVYPDSVEHFCGPELMSDQRYIHWGHLLSSPTQGLAIYAVKLASGFHRENTAHEVDLGLSDGVQNGVLKWNKYLAWTCDQSFFWPSQKRTFDRRC